MRGERRRLTHKELSCGLKGQVSFCVLIRQPQHSSVRPRRREKKPDHGGQRDDDAEMDRVDPLGLNTGK